MGKRIDDLKLDDTPIDAGAERPVEARDRRRGPVTDDPRDTAWYQFVGEIDDVLAQDGAGWAFASLEGIKQTVERTKRVTEGQRRAVTNIANRVETSIRGQARRWW